ncbi:MAG: hypothetical protein KKB51_03870 [Candidatus Riflebacteria bacterium]|nr:hypothetical protein [Candidatus Riflebacteria bacterium]
MAKALEHFFYSSAAPDLAKSARVEILDAQIRQLVRQCKMPSSFIELDYQTEPSFFAALATYGQDHDLVLIQPDNPGGLTGLGIRSVRRVYLGGSPTDIGYLHHLRFHPAIRGGSFLARGYKAFRQIFNEKPLKVTLTSILEDNLSARTLLESNRASSNMPEYQPVSRFLTTLIPLSGPGKRWPLRHRENPVGSAFLLRTLDRSDLPALLALFDQAGRHNDGAPALTESDFNGSKSSVFAGLKITDMIGIFEAEELIGAIGIWNQQGYRQIVLSQLCRSLAGVRDLWQLGSRFWGQCPVPPTGEQVNYVLLDPWVIKPGREKELMPVLIEAGIREAQQRGALFAALGIAEKNPAISAVKTVFFMSYWSIIYQVFWPETESYQFGQRQMQIANLGAL